MGLAGSIYLRQKLRKIGLRLIYRTEITNLIRKNCVVWPTVSVQLASYIMGNAAAINVIPAHSSAAPHRSSLS